jgi:hypothetical protein
VTGSRPVVGQIAGRVLLEDGPLSDIDPTDHALATIASILEHPESSREAEKAATVEEHPIVDEQPLAPEPADADGYNKVGPGPMQALRFKWTVQRGDDGLYYVHETIGEYSTPIVSGPMSSEAAVKLVDEREAEAHRRFEMLRDEIAGRSSLAEFTRKGEA